MRENRRILRGVFCSYVHTIPVKDVDADARVEVEVSEKRVSIHSKLSAAALAEAIKEAGYSPVVAS